MEPIAMIGMGCRFPGAHNPDELWQLLRDGVDAIATIPSDRWDADAFYDPEPATPGKMNTRWGGFLDQVDQFDAGFFGITRREAERMDPQQRLFLETSWEALEQAGIAPDQLSGSATGVFVGIASINYDQFLFKGVQDLATITAYDGVGTTLSLAANRLSYLLNLRGPSLAIETACSSSLVAVHLACQSLRSQETNLCIVGGANLILSPELHITFSQARMMAPDGRCKTFDARADGYVRGEGCGAVVLKRLSDAIADQDPIWAVIRGSAVNQDGLSNGITAPNGPSQQMVIRQALDNAGVTPDQISYVEAHGTGTALGDPIEFRSLKSVLMKDRQADQPCWLGSVKTNFGHLEGAAGIAGLIKTALSLKHQTIPPHLHFQELNPYISFKGTTFEIPTTPQVWTVTDRRFAGVSAFSFGGTNCHLVLEEAPPVVPRQSTPEMPWHLLTLSAKSDQGLQQLAAQYAAPATTTESLADLCCTVHQGRTHFDHRLTVIADSSTALTEQLQAFTSGHASSTVKVNQTGGKKRPKIAFLFTGQGSQYIGMGRQLYESQPVFRAAFDRCDTILQSYLPRSIRDIVYAETDPLLDQTAYTQPALFALEYALAQLWQSWGIQPAAVMGHSVGEYVAACIAGVFSLEDGLMLIAERARLMQALPAEGAMVAIFASEPEVRTVIQGEYGVAIAAINTPTLTVIAGRRPALNRVMDRLNQQGIKTKALQVSHAFHSPLMEPMVMDFLTVAQHVTYARPQLTLISNVTGELASTEIASSDYWGCHILHPVRFAESLAKLASQGYQTLIEIGPKPTLSAMGQQCLPPLEHPTVHFLPSLRPGTEDWQQLLTSLSELYLLGVPIDWSGFHQPYDHRRQPLPTYPWQRQRYWCGGSSPVSSGVGIPIVEKTKSQPQSAGLPSIQQPCILDQFTALAIHQRRPFLAQHLGLLLQQVTGIDTQTIAPYKPLSTLGLDSLMATELRRRIETNWGVMVPIEYFAELTIDQFVTQVLLLLDGGSSTTQASSSLSALPSHWLPLLGSNPQAKTRLFCFAYAGAGISVFHNWSKVLSPEIELCPIQLPGRGPRRQEEPMRRLSAVVHALVPLIQEQSDCPFAFFGHSLGALLAFEVTRALRKISGPEPVHFFVSAARAPQLPDVDMPLHRLPDERLQAEVRRLQGTPEAILQDPQLMASLLPVLRADFALLETYLYTQDDPLELPITAFGGLQDQKVPQTALAAWREQTQQTFTLQMFPGNHFFLHHPQPLGQVISQTLQPQLMLT